MRGGRGLGLSLCSPGLGMQGLDGACASHTDPQLLARSVVRAETEAQQHRAEKPDQLSSREVKT